MILIDKFQAMLSLEGDLFVIVVGGYDVPTFGFFMSTMVSSRPSLECFVLMRCLRQRLYSANREHFLHSAIRLKIS